ncbi:hypothetical protein DIPPA_15927 [Diplonema papillatum]|nr:hypothetical protein DIPPA_15927 [Diplonema papillatum]
MSPPDSEAGASAAGSSGADSESLWGSLPRALEAPAAYSLVEAAECRALWGKLGQNAAAAVVRGGAYEGLYELSRQLLNRYGPNGRRAPPHDLTEVHHGLDFLSKGDARDKITPDATILHSEEEDRLLDVRYRFVAGQLKCFDLQGVVREAANAYAEMLSSAATDPSLDVARQVTDWADKHYDPSLLCGGMEGVAPYLRPSAASGCPELPAGWQAKAKGRMKYDVRVNGGLIRFGDGTLDWAGERPRGKRRGKACPDAAAASDRASPRPPCEPMLTRGDSASGSAGPAASCCGGCGGSSSPCSFSSCERSKPPSCCASPRSLTVNLAPPGSVYFLSVFIWTVYHVYTRRLAVLGSLSAAPPKLRLTNAMIDVISRHWDCYSRREHEAEIKRLEGNVVIKKSPVDAMELYTQALLLSPPGDVNRIACYANRAQCKKNACPPAAPLRGNETAVALLSSSVDDCTAALAIRPDHEKALYRKAVALRLLDEHVLSLECYATLLSHHPKNEEAHRQACLLLKSDALRSRLRQFEAPWEAHQLEVQKKEAGKPSAKRSPAGKKAAKQQKQQPHHLRARTVTLCSAIETAGPALWEFFGDITRRLADVEKKQERLARERELAATRKAREKEEKREREKQAEQKARERREKESRDAAERERARLAAERERREAERDERRRREAEKKSLDEARRLDEQAAAGKSKAATELEQKKRAKDAENKKTAQDDEQKKRGKDADSKKTVQDDEQKKRGKDVESKKTAQDEGRRAPADDAAAGKAGAPGEPKGKSAEGKKAQDSHPNKAAAEQEQKKRAKDATSKNAAPADEQKKREAKKPQDNPGTVGTEQEQQKKRAKDAESRKAAQEEEQKKRAAKEAEAKKPQDETKRQPAAGEAPPKKQARDVGTPQQRESAGSAADPSAELGQPGRGKQRAKDAAKVPQQAPPPPADGKQQQQQQPPPEPKKKKDAPKQQPPGGLARKPAEQKQQPQPQQQQQPPQAVPKQQQQQQQQQQPSQAAPKQQQQQQQQQPPQAAPKQQQQQQQPPQAATKQQQQQQPQQLPQAALRQQQQPQQPQHPQQIFLLAKDAPAPALSANGAKTGGPASSAAALSDGVPGVPEPSAPPKTDGTLHSQTQPADSKPPAVPPAGTLSKPPAAAEPAKAKQQTDPLAAAECEPGAKPGKKLADQPPPRAAGGKPAERDGSPQAKKAKPATDAFRKEPGRIPDKWGGSGNELSGYLEAALMRKAKSGAAAAGAAAGQAKRAKRAKPDEDQKNRARQQDKAAPGTAHQNPRSGGDESGDDAEPPIPKQTLSSSAMGRDAADVDPCHGLKPENSNAQPSASQFNFLPRVSFVTPRGSQSEADKTKSHPSRAQPTPQGDHHAYPPTAASRHNPSCPTGKPLPMTNYFPATAFPPYTDYPMGIPAHHMYLNNPLYHHPQHPPPPPHPMNYLQPYPMGYPPYFPGASPPAQIHPTKRPKPPADPYSAKPPRSPEFPLPGGGGGGGAKDAKPASGRKPARPVVTFPPLDALHPAAAAPAAAADLSTPPSRPAADATSPTGDALLHLVEKVLEGTPAKDLDARAQMRTMGDDDSSDLREIEHGNRGSASRRAVDDFFEAKEPFDGLDDNDELITTLLKQLNIRADSTSEGSLDFTFPTESSDWADLLKPIA